MRVDWIDKVSFEHNLMTFLLCYLCNSNFWTFLWGSGKSRRAVNGHLLIHTFHWFIICWSSHWMPTFVWVLTGRQLTSRAQNIWICSTLLYLVISLLSRWDCTWLVSLFMFVAVAPSTLPVPLLFDSWLFRLVWVDPTTSISSCLYSQFFEMRKWHATVL